MQSYPFVTAMIVARNEHDYIEKCFESFLNQTYPSDRYEILIIDGESDDDTLELAKAVEDNAKPHLNSEGKLQKVEVRYLTNEKHLLASGWNLGIKEAKGEYTVRVDAHGFAYPDFIEKNVETMLHIGDAAVVGGTLDTLVKSETGRVISYVLSSPFGVGNSRFRYSEKAGYVDTVAFGLYRKSIFDEVGYFDETLKRNQDNDMHSRIRAVGGKFYLNPEIKSAYYARETVKGLFKQGFQNGEWNFILRKKNKSAMGLRHAVPLFFSVFTFGSVILGRCKKGFWILLTCVYALYIVCAFVFASKKTKNIKNMIEMVALFWGLHMSYGIGSIKGIFEKEGTK